MCFINKILKITKDGQKKMYFQKPGRNSEKPGRNSENLEKISKKSLATLLKVKRRIICTLFSWETVSITPKQHEYDVFQFLFVWYVFTKRLLHKTGLPQSQATQDKSG